MTFEIGIPTLNRADLLLPSLWMYKKDFPNTKLWILDNGNQNLPRNLLPFNYIINDENIGVAASWNVLCEKIFETSDYALILNDDIYLGKNEREIHALLDARKFKDCFIRATPDWCAFLIPKKIWEKIGKFDESFFPAYYEDKSYEYRMKLNGIIPKITPDLNPVIYKSSQTLEKMPSILEGSKKNKEIYINMWGGIPTKEKFKTPFNK